MQPAPPSPRVVRFGLFEADLVAGELRKRGRKIELQDQPFHVLALLLRRPKEVVTREELRQALWPADTFVEFDESLNKAVQKLRQSLGDSADNPRFIETLPRKGYRFIAPVEVVNGGGGWRLWLIAAVAVVAIIAAGAAWFWSRPGKPSDAELTPVPLTAYPGIEESPSFSPDGTQVAFQWCLEAPWNHCDIYIKQIGVETPFRLTDNPADEYSPAWSPDGQTIAFLRDVIPGRTALVLIPHRKGPERVLAEFDEFRASQELSKPYLAWTPDSKWVVSVWREGNLRGAVLFLLSVETGEKRRLTSRSVDVVGDTAPAFSPDGRTLAFTRQGFSRSDLYLLRLAEDYRPQGEPERIVLDNPSNSGAAWTSDGSEIVFTSGKWGSYGGWRMRASKSAKPRRLAFASGVAPAVSRQGNRLAFVVYRYDTNIWRVELQGSSRKPGLPAKLVSSSRADVMPEYSPDGKRIVFLSNRSGAVEIWVCESDGSNPVQLTALGETAAVMGARWSPDGQSIAFTGYPSGNGDVYVVSLKGGAPRRLTTHPSADKWPYWSRDGQWLYFCSMRTGEPGQIWKMPFSGGEEIQITHNGGDFPQVSPDGMFVYYEKGWPSKPSVWRIPVEGGEETKVLDSVHLYGKWVAGKDGIYFFTAAGEQGQTDIKLYEFVTGKTTKILTIKPPPAPHIAISPDGRTILYSQWDETGSDLMLVENFR